MFDIFSRTAAMVLAGGLLMGAGAFAGAAAGVTGAGGAGAARTATENVPQTNAHYTGYRHGHRYRRRHYRYRRGGYVVARRFCHRHRRVIRVWSRRHHRWVRRVVFGPRHCHARRIYVR